MTDAALQQLLDLEAIKQLKYRYLRAMDAQDWATFAATFTDDAEIFFGRGEQQLLPPNVRRTSDGRYWVPRDELTAWTAQGMRDALTVHHAHMPDITFIDADRATGIWSMTDHSRLAADTTSGWFRAYATYEDDYVRTASGWRIRRSVYSRTEFDRLISGGTA